MGQNRLECRSCPYEFLINQRYFERKEMKRKEVDDVLGGPDAWANVDKTDGTLYIPCPLFFFCSLFWAMQKDLYQRGVCDRLS